MSVEILPVHGLPEVRAGDDLVDLLAAPLASLGLADRDIVAVTQKIVSKAEGRVVPDAGDKEAWVALESRRIVARRGDLVIAETRHGFVCANAGVDGSNVRPGSLALLPEDPDGSAERLRAGLRERLGVDPAVVVTDTFGRPWRRGLVNVAIGCAGLPSLVDLRGTADHVGRRLEATIVALADEVAAASGLVMGKAARIPVAVVRGVTVDEPNVPATEIVRPPEEDLFRESPLQSLHARRTIRSFGEGHVPREAAEEAVRAACTAPAPHHTRPWLFVALESGPARRTLLAAMAEAWRADLRSDRVDEAVIARRIRRSDEVLAAAPLLIVPCVRLDGAHDYPDDERREGERDLFVLSAGAAIQTLVLALHAQGLASAWMSSTAFCREETRQALDLDDAWLPMGTVAVGPPPAGSPPPRPSLRADQHVWFA